MNETRLWVADLLSAFAGQENTLTIPRPYIEITGSIEDALLLSQIIYWTDRTKMENGWFAKSYPEWENEIALSKYQVSAAVKRLKDAGVETMVKKFNGAPTVHYCLRKSVFELWIVKKLDERKSRNLTNESRESSQSLTETTSEPTSDINANAFGSFNDTESKPSTLPIVKVSKTELDAQYDLIAKTWDTTANGFIVNLRAMIFGSTKCKGEWLLCKLSPPASIDEVQEFAPYMSIRTKNNSLDSKPTKPETIQRWFCDYRAEKLRNIPKPPPAPESIPSSPIHKIDTDFQAWVEKQGQPS